ncbi:hypothetical protein OAE83_00450 [bacterium]|nr:hypothetical protein [bacterium]
MIKNFLATFAVLGASALSGAIPVMAQTQSTQENHANYAGYWLLIQTYTTAPSHTLEPTVAEPEGAVDLAHQKRVLDSFGVTRETMDSAPLATKLELIKQNNFSFVEAEATGSEVIPMPSRQACETSGKVAINRLTVPSFMTTARYTCLPGK